MIPFRRKSMALDEDHRDKYDSAAFGLTPLPLINSQGQIIDDLPPALAQLPHEILVHILSMLDAFEVASVSMSCSSLYDVAAEGSVWRGLYTTHFKNVKPFRPLSRRLPSRAPTHKGHSWIQTFRARYTLEANWRKGRCTQTTLQGHNEAVWGIQFNGDTLVSGSEDGSLRVWDMPSQQCMRIMRGHDDVVNSFHFEGDRVATGSDDCTVRLWDVNTGQCMHTMQGHTAPVWMLELATGINSHKLVSGSCDRDLRVWDLHTGECDHVLRGHEGRIYYLQIKGNTLFSGSHDKTVKAWDLRSGQCTHTFLGKASVHCLQSDKEGDRVVTGYQDGTLGVYSLRTNSGYRMYSGNPAPLWHVQFNGRHAVTPCENSVQVWDLDKPTTLLGVGLNRLGVPLGSNQAPMTLKPHSLEYVKYFQLKHNRLVSGGQDGSVRVFDMASLDSEDRSPTILRGHTDSVEWLEFKKNKLVTCSKDCTIKIWSF